MSKKNRENHNVAKNDNKETPNKRKKECKEDTLYPVRERKLLEAMYTSSRGRKRDTKKG